VQETSDDLAVKNGYCVGLDDPGVDEVCTSDGDCNAGLRCYIRQRSTCLRPCADEGDCGGNACVLPDDTTPDNTTRECVQACMHLANCVTTLCDRPLLTEERCQENCAEDPSQAQEILGSSCQELSINLCSASPELQRSCNCPGNFPGQTNAGEPCQDADQCDAGNLLPVCLEDWPRGGYCSALGCHSDQACGQGRVCIQLDTDGTSACFQGCQSDQGCRQGYVCLNLSEDEGGPGVCFPDCQSDEDCPQGTTCQTDGSCL
jgi:hypothetical protein